MRRRARDRGRSARGPAGESEEISLILLELGGAFTAAVAVDRGQIVDGVGGTSGPIGWQAAGALDGEVAFLAGTVDKALLFGGGAETVAARSPRAGARSPSAAYVEGAVKAVAQLRISAPGADEVFVSGRSAADTGLLERLHAALSGVAVVRRLEGFALVAKQGAQGAALLADGLAGGRHEALVERLRIREAEGTVLDHLHVITAGGRPPPAGSRCRWLRLPGGCWWRASPTRPLAASAARAGWRVTAVDAFGDLDLRACARVIPLRREDGGLRSRRGRRRPGDASPRLRRLHLQLREPSLQRRRSRGRPPAARQSSVGARRVRDPVELMRALRRLGSRRR